MLSTFTSYNLITRDLLTSLTRTQQDSINAREETYYKENIGKVTSVDEFLDDYRLFNYAMKAYGLEDMTYAAAFMRKVLESDLSDDSSFANSLTDSRYRDFAAAFNFQEETPVAQTEAQLDDVIGLYTAGVESAGSAIQEETRYYNIVIDKVDNVTDIFQNDRLKAYVFQAFGIDEDTYSYQNIRDVMTSDIDDTDSYVNQTYVPYIEELEQKIADATTQLSDTSLTTEERSAIRADITTWNGFIDTAEGYLELASAFNFNEDGTVPDGETAQTADMKAATNEAYTLANPRVTSAAALLNKAYFEEAIQSITTVDDFVADSRLVDYVRTAYELTEVSIVNATIENILTSDPDDPTSYIYTVGNGDERFIALASAFNFNEDGTLDDGVTAQVGTQTVATSNLYMVHYNDADDEADETLISGYKADVAELESVDDFIDSDSVVELALKAFGLDPDSVSTYTLKQVLLSDLNDPKSYVYQLKDERFVELAKAFNFDEEGAITVPLMAQSETQILAVSQLYVLEKSRFGTDEEQETAEEEASYYSEEIQKIETLDEFLSNERLVNFVLEANRIDPETVTPEFLQEVFASDLDDPESVANTQENRAWRWIVSSFNFDAEGNVADVEDGTIQLRQGVYKTIDYYIRQAMEETAGEDNAGVRLALYFERKAPTITSAYDILADDALYEVFKVTYGVSDEVGNADVDAQAEMIERYLDLEELQDPEFVSKMIVKFAVLYDTENNVDTSAAVTVLSGGTAGVSADLLLSLAQLRAGGS
ncbi:DUF1217 domain-containing protein [Rhizobium sp. TRM95111]|uniref:DUF1217 domain-containing protein n=1 Tax=Rhizobium alarense TaxID=2846851 RepID=UPI001F2409FD|nr:DUF1217 domain-containing protein [Rhizobium alarense]MCF3640651.1 DUF1217 domain-containing protein [Rhizobium alarense]